MSGARSKISSNRTGLRIPNSLRQARPAHGAGIRPKALALAVGMACASTGLAQEVAPESDAKENVRAIETIEVYGQQGVPYKASRSGDQRHAADLAATPQTMTILTQTQIRDSGKTDLKEILAAQAGITLGTGENGNAFGDRYIIRGHEARSDVFVDGVRDPGMTTRESFATEQIEITKGPSSTFAGRGSTGGAVNGITKQASVDNQFALLEGGIGTDDHHRITLDVNEPIGDRAAFRANFLDAAEDVPNRGPAESKRQGALVSGFLALNDRLSLVADAYYLKADDLPDLGSYFDRDKREPVKNIPVYLQTISDFLDTEVKTFSFKTDYQFSDAFRLQNTVRYGLTDNGYVTTGAHGGTRDLTDPEAPGAATITLSGHQGWQQVDYFVDQLNLFRDFDDGSRIHQMVFGVEYTSENVTNGVFALDETGATNCILPGQPPRGSAPGTVAPPQAGYCALGADGEAVNNINTLLGRTVNRGAADSDFDVDTISLSVMDTVTLNQDWSLFAGLRYDHFDYANLVNSRGDVFKYDYSDAFWNGHLGLVRQVAPDSNVYLTYSTATNINGGESDVGASCGYGGLCGSPDEVVAGDPEHTENIELGTKWSLFDQRLLATAALFRITKDDVMESVGDAYSTLGTLNTGKNRVQGVEFSLTGSITEKLSAQFSAAFMESEVLESFNADDVGRALSNFANDSIFLQLRYEPAESFAFGGSVTWKSEMYGGQPDTAAGFDDSINDYSIVVPSFEVVDLFVNYYPADRLNLRLNVNNVTNESYWLAAYRSGSFMYLGESRNVRATLTWEF